jgi:hypothetical protein
VKTAPQYGKICRSFCRTSQKRGSIQTSKNEFWPKSSKRSSSEEHSEIPDEDNVGKEVVHRATTSEEKRKIHQGGYYGSVLS